MKAVVVSLTSPLTRKQIDKLLCRRARCSPAARPTGSRLDENGELVGGIAKFVTDQQGRRWSQALGLAAQHASWA